MNNNTGNPIETVSFKEKRDTRRNGWTAAAPSTVEKKQKEPSIW
jgi:hypothetical protein